MKYGMDFELREMVSEYGKPIGLQVRTKDPMTGEWDSWNYVPKVILLEKGTLLNADGDQGNEK